MCFGVSPKNERRRRKNEHVIVEKLSQSMSGCDSPRDTSLPISARAIGILLLVVISSAAQCLPVAGSSSAASILIDYAHAALFIFLYVVVTVFFVLRLLK